jgi:hypothetical protein
VKSFWEGKAKSSRMTGKGINSEGVTFEYTWAAQIEGFGKANGWMPASYSQ